jgi:hypothetical protein
LRSDVLQGHLSAALCHMANISYQLGQKSTTETVGQVIEDSQQEQIQKAWERMQEHLFFNWVDTSKTSVTLGPWLQMDSQTERFIGEGEYGVSRFANEMLTRDYRKPFVVPEQV